MHVIATRASLEMALVLTGICHVPTLNLLARLEMTVGKSHMPNYMLNITLLLSCTNISPNPLPSFSSFLYSKGIRACNGNAGEIGNDSW